MHATTKIFLACAFGAFIGALVALQLGFVSAPLGALVGFAGGYLLYEPFGVIKALGRAYRGARGWRLDREKFREAHLCGLLATTLAWDLSVFLLFLAVALELPKVGSQTPTAAFVIFFLLPIPLYFGISLGAYALTVAGRPTFSAADRAEIRHFACFGNPIAILLYWLPIGIFRGIRGVPHFFAFLGRFGFMLVKFVHSDLRLLCGTDAAIGAGIGYFAGNALVGALAGGVLGVLNFELVSRRLLKLVPARLR